MSNDALIAIFLAVCLTEVTAQQCTTTGFICQKCNIVLCPAQGASPITIETCGEGRFCKKDPSNTDTGLQCAIGPCVETNDPQPFRCSGAGTFPSATNVTVSYFCEESNKLPAYECVCDEKKKEVYDLATGTCTDKVERAPITCEQVGHRGNISKTFCYICDDYLSAIVYVCPTVKGLDKGPKETRAMKCSPYKPPTTGENNTNTDNMKCKRNGQCFPDPQNCKAYYKCNGALEISRAECSAGRFDASSCTCVSGSC